MSFSKEEKILMIKKMFGNVERNRDGINVAVACPNCKKVKKVHSLKKKKLAIRLDDDRINCWVCGLKGKLIKVIQDFKPQYVGEYLNKFGKDSKIFFDKNEKLEKTVIPPNFKLLAPNMSDYDLFWAKRYVTERNLDEKDLYRFSIGVSDHYSMKNRIILLSFDEHGELNYYTGRHVYDHPKKYWNSPCSKKEIIFNEINIDWKKELTLVEGPLDLVRCDDNATCLLGCELHVDSKLFSKIYKNKTPIILALDKDKTNKAWQKIAKTLDSFDISVKILELKKHSDVGDMTKSEFLDAKESAMPWSRKLAFKKKLHVSKLRPAFIL